MGVVLPTRRSTWRLRRGHGGRGGEPQSLPAHPPLPSCMPDFGTMIERVDVETMMAIGGALLIAAFVLMCCFLCVYCKLASVLR